MELPHEYRALLRLETGVPGLDVVLGGGIPVGRTCLVSGLPGTGKTTLGNQIAFHHATTGGHAVVVTLLSETHDLMLANLRGFRFFDPALVGERVHYFNLFGALEEHGLAEVIAEIRRVVRNVGATLMVVDGAAVLEDVAPTPLALRQFTQQLQAQAAVLGVTTLLLTGYDRSEVGVLGAHVDGVLILSNERLDVRHLRTIEVLKLRGGHHLGGVHEHTITGDGLTVHPRLESVMGRRRPAESWKGVRGLSTGISGLDTMLGGSLLPSSSTLVMGTPGVGKTLLGLSFLMEGITRGEPGVFAGFHETEADLIATAARIGLDLESAIAAGLIRVLWTPPLELSADAWAWTLLTAVSELRAQRVFVDALTDVQRISVFPRRMATFTAALVNELRSRGATALLVLEIDAYADQQLVVPVPAASAMMDNGILLRQVELNSTLHRLVSVPKARRMGADPAIREFTIGKQGITVSKPFGAESGLLTGQPDSAPGNDPS